MGKITRLSLNNIKKHKLEAFSLGLLIMFCMFLLGSSLAAFPSVKTIFSDMMATTDAWENFMLFKDRDYNEQFRTILEETENVAGTERAEIIYDMSTRYTNKEGKKQALFMVFVSAEEEAKIEKPIYSEKLSDEEIASLEHPVYLPFSAKESMGFKPGETFDIIYGTRHFPFTIAGFYESFFFNEQATGLKIVVTDKDYDTLCGIMERYQVLFFNTEKHTKNAGTFVLSDYEEAFEEKTNLSYVEKCFGTGTYEAMELQATLAIKELLIMLIAMAAVITVCVAFMIWYRITTDIKEQLVSIGVLEALGYTSREIALSYVFEYIMTAAAGIAVGAAGSFIFAPALFHMGETMTGYHGRFHGSAAPIIISAVFMLLFVSVLAFIRASRVRKYPPVMTFRKGISDHHFRMNSFPLRKTGKNVHLRLAMKSASHNVWQSIGLAFCMTLAVTTVLTCFIMFNALGRDKGFIRSVAGIELSDVRMSVTETTDAEEFAEELRELPEVRKVLLNSSILYYVNYPDLETTMNPTVYKDYNDTENISVIDGRYPENDNELMVTKIVEKLFNKKVGDSLTVSYGSTKQNYIISGIVASATNGGANVYFTEEGIRRVDPLYKPQDLEIYLTEGTDKEAFREYLTSTYGRSLTDMRDDGDSSGSYEERVRAAADKRIAELMAVYGVSHVEYAITSGDTVITGNNNDFRVKSFLNITDILDTQLAGTSKTVTAVTSIFTVISAVVVMIILLILMSSTIRKQRRELGIMKGMGYTSRELMLQLAFRIVPSSVAAVILGTLLAHLMVVSLRELLGTLVVSIPAIIAVDVLILLFCFVCAYAGARKIKEISVYELMSE